MWKLRYKDAHIKTESCIFNPYSFRDIYPWKLPSFFETVCFLTRSVVTELFIKYRKLNISLVFITQSYFRVLKDVKLNSTHFLIMKIPNKREL